MEHKSTNATIDTLAYDGKIKIWRGLW
jgi:hypothetical protein